MVTLEDKISIPENLRVEYFFNIDSFRFKDLFEGARYVWDPLAVLEEYVQRKVEELLRVYDFRKDKSAQIDETAKIEEKVYIGKGTRVEPYAVIEGPAIIGENCIIQTKSHIRNNVVIGEYTRVGNTEIKHSILLGGIGPSKKELSHFAHRNYIGHSIIGRKVIFGAAVTTASLRADWSPVVVKVDEKKYNTGLFQFGAIVGDYSTVGCGITLNPGSIIGKNVLMHNIPFFIGFAPSNCEVRPKRRISEYFEIVHNK